DPKRLRGWKRPAREPIRECRAINELEDEGVSAVRLLGTVDRRDVRMIERGQRARLAFEPRQTIGMLSDVGRQDLESHLAAKLRVARAIDLAHTAGAEQRSEDVCTETAASQCFSALVGHV